MDSSLADAIAATLHREPDPEILRTFAEMASAAANKAKQAAEQRVAKLLRKFPLESIAPRLEYEPGDLDRSNLKV